MSVRLTAVGVCLPGNPVQNDAWPSHTTSTWTAPTMEGFTPTTDGQSAMKRSLAALASDPFAGSVLRHIIPAGVRTSAMEIAAATDALEKSGIAPEDVGLLIQQSSADDVILPTNTTLIHEALRLPEDCFCTSIEAGNNSFLAALSLTDRMLAVTPGRCGLIINSSQRSRLVDVEARWAPWFGDGATAVVIEPSSSGGVIAQTHRVDPSMKRAYCIDSVGTAPWTDGGSVELRVDSPDVLQFHFLCVVDRFVASCRNTLSAAGVSLEDVRLVVIHQPAGWLLPAVAEVLELREDQVVSTFAEFGSVAACNIPLGLNKAMQAKQISDGDLVLMVSGGAGIVWTSLLIRWSS